MCIPPVHAYYRVTVDGQRWLRCKKCHQHLPETPEYFEQGRLAREWRGSGVCHACRKSTFQPYGKRGKQFFNRRGFIYFMALLEDFGDYPAGSIKVGFSSNIPQRMRSLAIEYRAVRCVARIHGVLADEMRLHEHFEHLRIDHEFFKPDPALLQYIDDNAEVYVYERRIKERTQ